MSQTAHTYLAALKNLHKDPVWIPTSELFAVLRGQEVRLTGHAGEFDPLFHT